MFNPLSLINPIEIWKLIKNVFDAFKGVSLLAFGTTRVGKATLWHYLETGTPSTQNLARTETLTPIAGGKFKLRDITLAGIRVRVRAMDVPGDNEYRHLWKEALTGARPRGIIFMFDHRANVDEGGSTSFDSERLKEHYEAFEYLRDLILSNEEVRKKLRGILVLANKEDAWPRELTHHKLLKESRISSLFDRFAELPDVTIRTNHCSALQGSNVYEEIRWIVQSTSAR